MISRGQATESIIGPNRRHNDGERNHSRVPTYRWGRLSGHRDLGGKITLARDIDDRGTVVGSSQLPTTPQGDWQTMFGHAVRYEDHVGELVDLNTLIDPLSGMTLEVANAIRGNYIAGWGEFGGILRGYRLHTDTGQLDVISGGWQGPVQAMAVNSAGDTVGGGYIDAAMNELAAWIYTDQIGFKKLNDLIDPTSGWDLRAAWGFNENDEVVGWGYHNGVVSAYRLRLSPQTLTCNSSNICGGSGGGGVCLFADGVVDIGGGQYVAVFGFDNAGSTSVHPNTNQVLINGTVVPSPDPAPPGFLPPGNHPGAFLPKLAAGQTVTWNVDGKTVSASAPGAGAGSVPTRAMPKVSIGASGYGVQVEGTLITIKADLSPWQTPPANEPTAQNPPDHGDPFMGTLTGQMGVSPTGAATYTVPITIPPGIAGMAPNLSVVYNSQGGDGIAGQGWELSGLSMIYRCPRTRAQDGYARSVHMDAFGGDGICLDGKRLFETSPGVYQSESWDLTGITLRETIRTLTSTTPSISR